MCYKISSHTSRDAPESNHSKQQQQQQNLTNQSATVHLKYLTNHKGDKKVLSVRSHRTSFSLSCSCNLEIEVVKRAAFSSEKSSMFSHPSGVRLRGFSNLAKF